MILKEYQKKYVEKLLNATKELLDEGIETTQTLVFEAPTGSGKTVMMQQFLKSFWEQNYGDFAFIWLSIGDLSEQSKRSFENKLEGSDLIFSNFEDIQDKTLRANEILFVNWEAINRKKKKDEKSEGKERDNIRMRENERNENLKTFCENTREAKRKIILIIDESHRNLDTENSLEIIEGIIKPLIQIEVSATPKNKVYDQRVKVRMEEVIKEGMIKKEVLINEKMEDNPDLESDVAILCKAFEKQKELEEQYLAEWSQISPLVLIQLPSEKKTISELDKTKKERIQDILREKFDITVLNQKLAIRLSDNNDKVNLDLIQEKNSPVKALIFKQAIATWRDCPRAQILVMFREIKSITFEIQTVGRILRMPELKHYQNESLNRAYVYTDLPKQAYQIEKTAKDFIKNSLGYRDVNLYNMFALPSFFNSRIDYQDVWADFQFTFRDVLLKKVDGSLGKRDSLKNKEKLLPYLSEDVEDLTEEIISNRKMSFKKGENSDSFSSLESFTEKRIFDENTATFKKDKNRIEEEFKIFVSEQVKPQFSNIARSVSPIMEALIQTLKTYFFPDEKASFFQKLILKNTEFFISIIEEAKNEYLPKRQKDLSIKLINKKKWIGYVTPEHSNSQNFWEYQREIPAIQTFTSDKCENYPKSIIKPCSLNFDSEWELDFISFFLEANEKVKFRYKNGVNKKDYFWIRYEENWEIHTFYPDRIVYFQNGTIGIFDTKSGFTLKEGQAKLSALATYIQDQNKKGVYRLVWGFITIDPTSKKMNIYTDSIETMINFEEWIKKQL